MNNTELYAFLQQHDHAVLATVSAAGEPEAALVGVAVTEALELVFDTSSESRKYANLLTNPKVALVVGWEHQATLQYEGAARQLAGDEAVRYKHVYFQCFPAGREREAWPDTVYFVVQPLWLRYSDFSRDPPDIVEFERGL